MESGKKGRFITLEGIEGVGKSTHMATVHRFLQAQGIDCVITREPGGTAIGEDIRRLLLGHKHHNMNDRCELLLMFAARAQHLAEVIIPALNRGQWVLCDRFTDATYAYQGGGRGVPESDIAALENWVHGDRQPDITLLLDADVSIGMQRIKQRSEADRFESETLQFFERVRANYLQRAAMHAARITIIDAAKPLAEVESALQEQLTAYLARCQQ